MGGFMVDNKFISTLLKTNFNIIPTSINKLNDIGTMNIVYLVKFNTRKIKRSVCRK